MLKVRFILNEIKDQYLLDNRPWIIGYSGGKDSTMLLQMVWYALREIPKEQHHKKIHVVCNDTLVENPKVMETVDKSLENIAAQTSREQLPITVAKTTPALEDTFWVNLIGKGYPTPNNTFRWCTDRLKIRPTTRYIQEQIKKNGEVIILLGTREDESSSRKKSMQKFQIANQRLRRHMDLALAYVYAPLKNITTNELWEYLLQVPSPWNKTNRDLITLYKNGTGGDCPLVIDRSTSSCGQSRFGCWVCTVVKRDRSMEALIDNGEEWLEPMLDLRDWLSDNRHKNEFRMMRRRNGQAGKGPYNLEARQHILTMLLEAQKSTKESLITNQELKAIQIHWNLDGFYANVYDIYNKIYNSNIGHTMNKQDKIKQQQAQKLKELCDKYNANFQRLSTLLNVELDKSLLRKRVGIQDAIKKQFEYQPLEK